MKIRKAYTPWGDEMAKEENWIARYGSRFQPFPGAFCMSWFWPWWWRKPSVSYGTEYGAGQYTVKGRPARMLCFPSGTRVMQLLDPIHGFDKPGATLPDPEDPELYKPRKAAAQ